MNTTIMILFLGLAILLIYVYINFKKMENAPLIADNEKIVSLNDQNFQQQISKGVILVDFWASWCMPCKLLAPVLNETSSELTGSARIGKLNVEQYQAVSAKYGVKSIPTMILFKDGKEISRFVGMKNKEFLVEQINQYN